MRVPMVLSLGGHFSKAISALLKIDASLSYAISSEFDVHIFRMKDNRLRVKFLTINDLAKTSRFEIKLFGFNSLGEKMLSRAIGSKILSNIFQTVDSNLFSLEYIFNLNQPSSRDLYNQFVGHKLRSLDKDNLVQKLKDSNVFKSHDNRALKMIADLELLENTAQVDQKKPSDQRRLTRLEGIKDSTQFDYSRFKFNLFSLAGYENESLRSTSKLTLLPSKSDEQFLNIFEMSTNNMVRYDWLKLWRKANLSSSNILVKTDDNYNLKTIIGNHWSRSYRATSLTEKEFESTKDLLRKSLPSTVTNQFQWPIWNAEKNSKQNIYLHQETLFTDKFFNEVKNVSTDQVRTALIDIIKTGTNFKSMPMSVDKTQSADLKDTRLTAFERHDYLNAYSKDWEQTVIPVKVAHFLNSNLEASTRYTNYRDLMDEVPLFKEIGDLLLAKLVPESKAAEYLVVRLNSSVNGKSLTDQFYPSASVYSVTTKLHEKLEDQRNFVIDREYKLSSYIHKNGQIISESELTKLDK